MKIISRTLYLSTSIIAVICSFALALGWEPSIKTIASAAFVALLFAANARDTQIEEKP